MKTERLRQRLLMTTIIWGGLIGGGALTVALPAQAQDKTGLPSSEAGAADDNADIVVTGSLFRRADAETASPLTVLSQEDLDRRGLNTVADAIRTLSSDNSGSIPTSFSNGFAAGASGVSLRGLGVNSTLVLFDGLRGANYPFADDGQKSFVDLNTIPQFAVERIEVLRDGASATYGADAIGGVVNVITRKQYQGIGATIEGGISQRGDAGNQRLSLIAGTGDLDRDGWSAYVGAEYLHADALMAKDRGFPYNTADLSSLNCGLGTDAGPCPNSNPGGGSGAGNTISAVVRRANQANPGNIFGGVAAPGALYQVLAPDGCAPGLKSHTRASGTFCEQDVTGDYGQLQPSQDRFGVTGRLTARIGDDLEAYAMGTFYRSEVTADRAPSNIRNTTPVNTNGVVLPARLANGQLNPNNPFAADGQAAQIFYKFGDIAASNTTVSKTWRGAAGLSGKIADKGEFSIEVTGMHTDLDATRRGYLNIAGLTAAIINGTYNFVDPSKNSDAVRQSIAPDVKTRSTSDLYMAQAIATYELANLPGGALQLGGTASIRREELNNPSANPLGAFTGINSVSANGKRTVSAASIELAAPVLEMLELDFAGRFDHYSDGYDRFSPKAGFKFTPIRELALRGTYSQGFRAPQFGEISGNVIGYISAPALPCAIVLAHGGTATASGGCTGGSAYVSGTRAVGINSTATADLKPETSRSFTLGAVVQPTPWFSMTLDYYNIRKKNFIAGGPDYGTAISAYYAGQTLPAGYTITLNDADPDHPDAPRTIALVNAPYVNAAEQRTSGLDFSATLRLPVTEKMRFTSQLDVTHILEFDLVAPGGTQHYVGTQGPYNLSSGAGTPAWRGSWSNTLDFGGATLSATAYYTSGYRSTGEDATGVGTGSDCVNALYDIAYCRTRHFLTVDMVGSVDVNRSLTLYANIHNLFDMAAPFNPANYAGINYNPTWSQQGLIGRSFRAGARLRF